MDLATSSAPDTTDASVMAGIQGARQRSRRALVGLAALLATVSALWAGIADAATFGVGTPSGAWLVVATAFSWFAMLRWRRRDSQLWIGLTAAATINAILCQVELAVHPPLEPQVLVVLLWASLLLHTAAAIALGVYSFAAAAMAGLQFASGGAPGPHDVVFGLALVSVVLPIVFGTMVQSRGRWVERRLHGAIRELQRRERGLESDLRRKAQELESSQQQLLQAQKLKTVGTMAAGLAHELNNVLTPVQGLAEFIVDRAEQEQLKGYGRRIIESASAAASITSALLTYTRQGTFHPVRCDVRKLLEHQVLPVLSRSLPRGIAIHVDLPRNLNVSVDRVLFQQAVTNLVFNAIDAMPDGGDIQIRAASRPIPGADTRADFCALTVADTGPGIPAEHMDRIFDPFFTSKDIGAGTGLGLAMVHGIMTRHGGDVLVQNTSRGAEFTLYFPLASAETADSESEWDPDAGDNPEPVILIVDQDQDILDELEELVGQLRCAPRCTTDPARAATLLTDLGDRVDLLLLDLDSDDNAGPVLFRTVRELLPDLPVILTSARSDRDRDRLLQHGPTRFLRKPVDATMLEASVLHCLGPQGEYIRSPTPVSAFPAVDASASSSGLGRRGR